MTARRRSCHRRRWGAAAAVLLAVAGSAGAACSPDGAGTMPACEPDQRLGIIAQSVPGAAYVPCVEELPTGWTFVSLDVDDDGSTITLESDRADRDVEISLRRACEVEDATPIPPNDEGVRTYQRIETIDPRFAGSIVDVFAGGCVESAYDFERGAHVALVTELQQAVDLFPRRELRQRLRADLGIQLDP